jgi:hypothetical protein
MHLNKMESIETYAKGIGMFRFAFLYVIISSIFQGLKAFRLYYINKWVGDNSQINNDNQTGTERTLRLLLIMFSFICLYYFLASEQPILFGKKKAKFIKLK